MNKVYIITRFDMDNCQKEIAYVYANKSQAKKQIDKLNDRILEDEQVFYTLESFNVIGDKDDN